jgi:hypothetical protein
MAAGYSITALGRSLPAANHLIKPVPITFNVQRYRTSTVYEERPKISIAALVNTKKLCCRLSIVVVEQI